MRAAGGSRTHDGPDAANGSIRPAVRAAGGGAGYEANRLRGAQNLMPKTIGRKFVLSPSVKALW